MGITYSGPHLVNRLSNVYESVQILIGGLRNQLALPNDNRRNHGTIANDLLKRRLNYATPTTVARSSDINREKSAIFGWASVAYCNT